MQKQEKGKLAQNGKMFKNYKEHLNRISSQIKNQGKFLTEFPE